MKRVLWLLLALSALSCRDPVHDDRVDALGGERPGEEPGPWHRRGQPCTVCHGGKGPGHPTFDLAGTVFATPDDPNGLSGVKIHIVDSAGKRQALFSNEVGNFWWNEGELQATFPIWVSVEYCGHITDMLTPIFREPACATCHTSPSQSTVDRVYVAKTPGELCP